MNEFEENLKINLDELNEDWKGHALKRYKYACEVSHLDKVFKKTGEAIASIKATLITQIKNENPKATVQQIEAFCVLSEEYIEGKNSQIETEFELNMAKNAVRAFDDRKSALENEVKLWGGNYFSSPVEDKASSPDEVSMKTKIKDEVTKKTRRRMNQNKRENN